MRTIKLAASAPSAYPLPHLITEEELDEDYLTDVRKKLGGYVEVVSISVVYNERYQLMMLTDEEGQMKGLEPNLFATWLYQGNTPDPHYTSIVGDVYLLLQDFNTRGHDDDELRGLPEQLTRDKLLFTIGKRLGSSDQFIYMGP